MMYVQVFTIIICLDVLMTTDRSLDTPNITDIVIQEYKDLCPLTETCMVDGRIQRNDSGGTTETGDLEGPNMKYICCSDCSCSESCGSDCCPDVHGLQIPFQTNEIHYMKCVHAQFRPYTPFYFNGRSFYMINECPLNYTKTNDYKEKCEANSYNRSSSTVIALELVPVSSMLTQKTFKNKFCALCHGESEDDLQIWDASFSCRGDFLLTPPVSFADMLYQVKVRRKCNLIYNPSKLVIGAEKCVATIDTCNVTGNWQEYDAVTEAACNSYRSTFAREYKNVHCYMCNTGKLARDYIYPICYTITTPIIRGEPFSILLDFNQLLAAESELFVQCSTQHVFDNVKNVCRRLWCNEGLKLSNDTCASIYQQIEGKIRLHYDIQLALIPVFEVNNELNQLELTSIIQDIDDQIITKFHAIGSTMCSIRSFIKLNSGLQGFLENLKETNGSLVLPYIDYIAYDVVLYDEHLNDVNARIAQIAGNIKLLHSTLFTVEDRNLSSVTKAIMEESIQIDDTVSLLNMSNMIPSGLVLPAWLNASLYSGFEYDTYGVLPLTKTELSQCMYTFIVTKQAFCPRLIFHKDEFNVYDDNINVSASNTYLNFKRSDVIFSENANYFSVCQRDFLSQIQYDRSESISSYSPLTLVTLVCTSVSIISLIITLSIYCIFQVLRSLPGLNNMGLVISLLVFFTMMFINAFTDIAHRGICKVIAVTLHASLLSSFSWMFICTWHMTRVFSSLNTRAYHRNVTKQFTHYVLYAESTTVIVICATTLISYFTSGSLGYADKPCFVAPNILVYVVAIPIACVVILNFAMFIYVIVTITKLPDVQKNNKTERHYLEIFIKLSTLTGLTWFFGFVYQFTELEVFSYIFTLLNASQGVLIMFSFVINKRVYNLCRGTAIGKSATSKSTRNTTLHPTRSEMTGIRL